MRKLEVRQLNDHVVLGGEPREPEPGPVEPPAPIGDPTEEPTPAGDPAVQDPTTPSEAPIVV